MIENFIRKKSNRLFIKKSEITLENRCPSLEELSRKFQNIDELGIYLHIPFCKQICPYCPYNKEIYSLDMSVRYVRAVIKEIDFYSDVVGNRPITSFYIGGGTPTTILHNGLDKILDHIFKVFNVKCDIHMESHPNDLSLDNLNTITSMGIQHLSTGVEALQDKHLKFLNRPYTVEEVTAAVKRATRKDFKCVNVDVIFDLPDQTCDEIEQTGYALTEMGIDQVAAYPLFRFPYTQMGSTGEGNNYKITRILQRRKMLNILERIFYDSGFERTSVWAFTRSGIPKYCSVTVPLYIGLGASGGSYLKDVFYLNTFNVDEYIKAIENGKMAIALSLDLSEQMQLAGWLYWRIYETRIEKGDFNNRFGKDFDRVFRKYIKPLLLLGFLKDNREEIVLSDKGTYYMHALEDLFSIEYISKLWGTSKKEPWPEKVVL